MNHKIPICFALFLLGGLFARNAHGETNSPPIAPTNIWERINYSWPSAPQFSLSSGEQWGQVSLGLRLDIMSIVQGFGFFKTNAITTRLYRANGEVVEPTAEGRELLNAPISTSWALVLTNGKYAPQVMTYFPWGTNTLEEAWIEVTIGSERYWVEIPYGFDRNPGDPFPPANFGGPPRLVPAMKSLTEHDHLVRWQNVQYDLGQTPDGREVSLKQSNRVDAESQVELYRSSKRQNLYSPRTAVRVVDADGNGINGQCVNLHLDDSHLRRTDTFTMFDRGANDTRCGGQIKISIGNKTYGVVVPSSLYKYAQGHVRKPEVIDFFSSLRIGMTLAEADWLSKSYIVKGIRDYPVSSTAGHEYQYVFPKHTGKVTLLFDSSNRLVSWKAADL